MMTDDSSDEAVTAMASPVADRTTALTRNETSAEPDLIQALPQHLKAGRTIYVRGHRACIIQMDYPNIFWCLDEAETIKHRNYEVDQEMFQVVQGTNGGKDIVFPARTGSSFRPLFRMPAIDSDAAQDADFNDAQPSSLVDALMGQLSLRPLSVYSNENGADISCFDTNARIHLLHCSSSCFRFPNKLVSMFVQDCSDCKIQYNSMISSIELLKCFSTEVSCTCECGTLTIESCSDITVTFPTSSTSVLIVCTNSRNVQLRADKNGTILQETFVTIEDQQIEGEGEGEGESSLEQVNVVPLVHPQIRTLWNGTSFDSQQIERDCAHLSGHIRNLNG